MAKSSAHKFGQLIGDIIESILLPHLEKFCVENELYLDYQGKTRSARNGKTVAWTDGYGNKHDLDFVLERNGSDIKIGDPVAFIECAWRRYTKHSRNKAQEIQGAILPLFDKYRWTNPFLGVILAGFFTEGSLDQLNSLGFNVLYFPYKTIVEAFQSESINIAFYEETPDSSFEETNRRIQILSIEELNRIKELILKKNQKGIEEFFSSLKSKTQRYVTRVQIIPLYGRTNEFKSIEDAIIFLESHSIYEGSGEFRKYELRVDFSNGDTISASFELQEKVEEFLLFISNQ